MTRRIPAPEENRRLDLLRLCRACGVATYPRSTPAELRPAHARAYSTAGLCESCRGRQRRAGVTTPDLLARAAACARCGVRVATRGFTTTELCQDCSTSDVACPLPRGTRHRSVFRSLRRLTRERWSSLAAPQIDRPGLRLPDVDDPRRAGATTRSRRHLQGRRALTPPIRA